MFKLSLDEAKKLLASYDAEIENQQKNLDVIVSLREILAQKVSEMDFEAQDEARGFGG